MNHANPQPDIEAPGKVYAEHDDLSRSDYLEAVASDNGVTLEAVLSVADLMGEDEEFDGLVTFIEDHIGQLVAAFGETA